MRKTIYLLVFLFIATTVNADWIEGNDFKMHYPQLPDPVGWDVDFGDWWLGDDFLCTETGQITDIHFWISWFENIENWAQLSLINISIWSNQPGGIPGGPDYSMPLEELWSRSFDNTQFVIAGPWDGLQGWFMPPDLYIPDDHNLYYQINIEEIPDPFWQAADNIYWLVINIEVSNLGMGWKTSTEHWEDNAVWGTPGQWFELYDADGTNIDLAFVITNDTQVPVQLSSFSAAYSNGTPTLFWTTQSESNNLGWNVYRSENDLLEQSLQLNNNLIPGAGTTSEPTDYIFDDDLEVVVNNEYWYWIESVESSGETETYGPITLVIPEDGDEPDIPEIPDIYGLHQNYPNPFNPLADIRSANTRISYMMDTDCTGTLKIYNLKGEEIVTLFNNLELRADEKSYVEWNGLDSRGNQIPAGVYIYELNTTARDYSRKLVIIK